MNTVVTTEDIRELMAEAEAAGDSKQVLKCRRALSGNFQAQAEVERVILANRKEQEE